MVPRGQSEAWVCSGGRMESWHRCCRRAYQGCNCTADIWPSVCHATRQTPPPTHPHTHMRRCVHTQPINPTGPLERSVPLKAFRASVFYTPNIIMHRGAGARRRPPAVIEMGIGTEDRGYHGSLCTTHSPQGCSGGLTDLWFPCNFTKDTLRSYCNVFTVF